MRKIDFTPYEWNRLRYDAYRLWRQGIRSGDGTIIHLQYGYDDRQTAILCLILKDIQADADHWLETYNPDIGF